MQLINSAVYEKEKIARAKAMEDTRKMKMQRRAEREQAKVLQYAQAAGGNAIVSTIAQPTAPHQILVNHVPFSVTHGGSKLVRLSSTATSPPLPLEGTDLPNIDDPNTANSTPKRVNVAGVTFVRSKNGNLHRLGAVASKKWVTLEQDIGRFNAKSRSRNPTTVKKKNELCKRFTTTGILFIHWIKPFLYAEFFNLMIGTNSFLFHACRRLLQGSIMPVRPRSEQSCHLQGLPSDWSMQCWYEL